MNFDFRKTMIAISLLLVVVLYFVPTYGSGDTSPKIGITIVNGVIIETPSTPVEVKKPYQSNLTYEEEQAIAKMSDVEKGMYEYFRRMYNTNVYSAMISLITSHRTENYKHTDVPFCDVVNVISNVESKLSKTALTYSISTQWENWKNNKLSSSCSLEKQK